MTISPFNRYISSAIGGAAFYHSWKISKGATVLDGTVQLVSDIVAGDISSIETYAGSSLSTALAGKFAKSPSFVQALITIFGVETTQALEQIGGIKEYTISDYIVGPVTSIVISSIARFLIKMLPNQWIQEDEFTAILDGLFRRIEETCNE